MARQINNLDDFHEYYNSPQHARAEKQSEQFRGDAYTQGSINIINYANYRLGVLEKKGYTTSSAYRAAMLKVNKGTRRFNYTKNPQKLEKTAKYALAFLNSTTSTPEGWDSTREKHSIESMQRWTQAKMEGIKNENQGIKDWHSKLDQADIMEFFGFLHGQVDYSEVQSERVMDDYAELREEYGEDAVRDAMSKISDQIEFWMQNEKDKKKVEFYQDDLYKIMDDVRYILEHDGEVDSSDLFT